MKKKTLIYMREDKLEHIGGPCGYLYNLKQELSNREDTGITFLQHEDGKVTILLKNIKNSLPQKIKKYYLRIRDKKEQHALINNLMSKKEKNSLTDLSKYDIVHFHTTTSLFMAKDSLKNYNGIVLLTSHTPKAPHLELLEDKLTTYTDSEKKKIKPFLEEVDNFAFKRADYIIFPCKEAEDPYFHTWKRYKEVRDESKIIYLPTGIPDVETSTNSIDIRKKYNIPEDAILISYIGRHNTVKGYENLKQIAENVLQNSDNIYFIIAGKEGPLYGLDNPKWIEIGWTKNSYDIIKASNAFILPNKETYFDLILLEAMSLGVPIILTETGGNKYFKKFNSNSLFFYNYGDINQATKIILNLAKSYNITSGAQNRQLFLEEFTIKKFTDNYLEILKKLPKRMHSEDVEKID